MHTFSISSSYETCSTAKFVIIPISALPIVGPILTLSVEGVDEVYFCGITVRVRVRNVIVLIFKILKYDNFGYEQYSFILKKFPVAGIFLSKAIKGIKETIKK